MAGYGLGCMVSLTEHGTLGEGSRGYAGTRHEVGVPPIVRRLGSIVSAWLVAGLLAPVVLVAPVAAAAPVPKVAIIVGPVGAVTESTAAKREPRPPSPVATRLT